MATVQTGVMSGVDESKAFTESFGNLISDRTVYHDPLGATFPIGGANGLMEHKEEAKLKAVNPQARTRMIDARPVLKSLMLNQMVAEKKIDEATLKSLTTGMGGAGTTDVVLTPFYLDTLLLDTSFKYTPARAIIPRVANKGLKAVYDTITSKGMARTAAEGAGLSTFDFTPARSYADMKYLYSKGAVTGQAIAAIPTFAYMGAAVTGTGIGNDVNVQTITAENAKKLNVLAHTQSLFELEENLIFNGNKSTSGVTGNPNGTEFDGIVVLQSTTNMYNAASTPLTLEMIDLAAEYAFVDGGRPTVGFVSANVYTQLIGLLAAKNLLAAGQYTTDFGFTAIRYFTTTGPIDIIPSQYLLNTTNNKRMHFLDLRAWEMRVLQDLTYKDLPDEDDNQLFLLKMYEVLICRNTSWNSGVYGIQ